LTEPQVLKLWDVIDNLFDEILFRLAISTGIRREDIVKIKWRDVDIYHGTVTYYESKKSRTRAVPIGGTTVLALKKYIVYLDKDQVWLFPGKKKGQHLTGRTAYNKLQNHLRKAELPSRPFHALRATCVKLGQKRGWTIAQMMELTGDTFRTLKEHYETPSDEEMKDVAKSHPIE